MATNALRVAPEWEATEFWLSGGPLVLVEFSKDGQHAERVRSRLDLGKFALIDPLPFHPMRGAVEELVDWVRGTYEPAASNGR